MNRSHRIRLQPNRRAPRPAGIVAALVAVAAVLMAGPAPAAAAVAGMPSHAPSMTPLSRLIGRVKANPRSIAEVTFEPSSQAVEARLRSGKTIAAYYPDPVALDHFQALLEHRGVEFSSAPPGGGSPPYALFAMILLGIGVGGAVLMRRRAKAGGGGGVPTRVGTRGRSGALPVGRVRRRRASHVSTRFTDVAGADEAVDELREIRDFLAHPDRFRRMGARIPKGVLLVGPPGTGKTLLARAVAGEAGAPFLSVSGSDFVEMYVGVGARRVRELFSEARESSPAIVFVDEIDAVGRRRSGGEGGCGEREQTLNQLLVEMDGFDAASGVIVMAATNRADVLDPALLRPGRFDRHIAVDPPDRPGRLRILEVHATGKPIDPGISLDRIAAATPGFTGADLANLLNESALLAARRRRETITASEIDDATLRVMAGPERRGRILTERERAVTACHEAGHAVVAHVLEGCDRVHRISIVSRGRSLGMTVTLPDQERSLIGRPAMLDRMAMTLAGRAAEEMRFGEVTSGAADDLRRATAMAEEIVKQFGMSERVGLRVLCDRDGMSPPYSERLAAAVDDEIRRLLDHAYAQASGLLRTHSATLDRLSAQLLERETLTGPELAALLDSRPPRLRPVQAG